MGGLWTSTLHLAPAVRKLPRRVSCGHHSSSARRHPAKAAIIVIPAEAGIQGVQGKSGRRPLSRKPWTPACAGVTELTR